MHALCYERGMEFDPANVPVGFAEMEHVIAACPAWEGRSLAQELSERRAAERRKLRKVPDWFSVQDLIPEPWEREARVPA